MKTETAAMLARLFPLLALKRAIANNDLSGVRQALDAGAATDGWRGRGPYIDEGMPEFAWREKTDGSIDMALHHGCDPGIIQALLDGGAQTPACYRQAQAWTYLGDLYDDDYPDHASSRTAGQAVLDAFWKRGLDNGLGKRRKETRLRGFCRRQSVRCRAIRLRLLPTHHLKRALREHDVDMARCALAAGAQLEKWTGYGPDSDEYNFHGPGQYEKVNGALEMAIHWGNPPDMIALLLDHGAALDEQPGGRPLNETTWQHLFNLYQDLSPEHVGRMAQAREIVENHWLARMMEQATPPAINNAVRRAARI